MVQPLPPSKWPITPNGSTASTGLSVRFDEHVATNFALCRRPFDQSPMTFRVFQSKCGREVVRSLPPPSKADRTEIRGYQFFFHQRGEACLGFDPKLLRGGDLRQMDTLHCDGNGVPSFHPPLR